MDTTPVGFNESHPVGGLLTGQVAKDLPNDPSEIDLRFLRMIVLSDTGQGYEDPVSGLHYTAVLYGNRIAWERTEDYLMGSCEQRTSDGNDLYRQMYYVAELFLKIRAIAGALYQRGKVKGGTGFYVNSKDLERLKDHPQYKELAEFVGLNLRPGTKSSYIRVTVTKFYERPAR